MRTRLALAAALATSLAACSSLKVQSDWDHSVDFSKFRTFTMRQGTIAKAPFMQQRIDDAIAANLKAKGFQQVPSNGDLEVYTHIKQGKEVVVNTTTVGTTSAYGPWGYPYGAWWGPGMGSSVSTVSEIPTGKLTIDIVATKEAKLVFRGVASDEASKYAGEEGRPYLQEAISGALAPFPPGPSK